MIRLYQRLGRGTAPHRCIESIFAIMQDLIRTGRDSVKETCIICVGYIGKMDDIDVLGRALVYLFVQFEQKSILLKGIVYTQVSSVYPLGCHY